MRCHWLIFITESHTNSIKHVALRQSRQGRERERESCASKESVTLSFLCERELSNSVSGKKVFIWCGCWGCRREQTLVMRAEN